MNKSQHLPAVLFVLGSTLILPSLLPAQNLPFTDSFMLENCHFDSRGRNPYFILEPGYQLILEGEEKKQFVRLEITVLHETKKVAGVQTRVVQEVEYQDSQLVEISRNYFAICRENNSVFYFGEDVDIYEDGVVVSHEGAWQAGADGARAGLMMPGILLLGARYFQEVAPDVAMDRAEILSISDVVETPAGTFTNCARIEETTPLEPGAKELKVHAPGIGLIQDANLKLVQYSSGFGGG